MTTIFTWLKAILTISGLGKMIAPTIKGWRLLQCNNDHRGYYLQTRQFYGTNNFICYIY